MNGREKVIIKNNKNDNKNLKIINSNRVFSYHEVTSQMLRKSPPP